MGLRTIFKKTLYKLSISKKGIILSRENISNHWCKFWNRVIVNKNLLNENKVIGVYNSNKSNLDLIRSNNLTKVKCNLGDYSDFENLDKIISNNKIDIIINCAGIFGSNNQSLENIEFENLINTFKINSVSIIKILQIMEKKLY